MIHGIIRVNECDLNLKMMLCGGQSFRWKERDRAEWIGVVSNMIWILKQSEEHIEYKVMGGDWEQQDKKENFECERCIRNYLRLDENLPLLYKNWSDKDPHFEKVAQKFSGIRILNQTPLENFFSFICSSNNNITRISSMIEKMCLLYGKEVGEFEGKTYYGFPKVSSLTSSSVEGELRKAGFGYRAKYIFESAKQLDKLGGEDWLEELKTKSFSEAKTELIKFKGVGPKVADCICLMSLGHLEAIPVDTHVFQIARDHYMPRLKAVKSVTDKVYKEIGDYFRELYGPLAGWAHVVLFCSDLKQPKTESSNKRRKIQNKNN